MKSKSRKSKQKMNKDNVISSPLEYAKKIIDDLENDLEKMKILWVQIRMDNPDFEQVSEKNWREKSSTCWLHGGTKLLETNELDRWLFHKEELSKIAQKTASRFIASWKKSINEKGLLGHYYSDDPRFALTSKKSETLFDFLVLKATTIENSGKGHGLEWRALKSFLCFLRETYPQNEVAFVEHIFPQKMDVSHRRIIRKIPSEVYPIPIGVAGDIIRKLAVMFRNSRPDAQLGFAETLGFCWLCLTASRLRLPTHVEMILRTKASAINLEGEFPTIQIPTFFGDCKIRISHRVANFLSHLSNIPSKKTRETILQKPLRSLTRAFDRALDFAAPNPAFGNITFLTLISHPHPFGDDYRYHPKK